MSKLETIWQIEKEAFNPEERSRKEFLERLIKNKNTILVYNKNGYAIGRELEWDFVNDKNFGKENTFYLISIAVVPNHQGEHIGDKLLKQFEIEARKRGYRRLTLHTNNKHMIRLAVRSGFRIIKSNIIDTKLKYYMGKWI
jgi:ribosomal protein S18 acetylase RimI-like enzyme